MKSDRRRAWLGFSATALVLVGVVTWLTLVLLQLDRDEVHARAQALTHERARLALWRVDSWLTPQIAREAMRPAREYRAFPVTPTAWTVGNTKLAQDSVKVQSPLLTAESPLFPVHFEIGPAGLTSPQVPLSNDRDLCEANGISTALLDAASARLHAFTQGLDAAALAQQLRGAVESLDTLGCNPVAPNESAQTAQGVAEYSSRQKSVYNLAQAADNRANPLARSDEMVGPLVPLWVTNAAGQQLVFARVVRDASGSRTQGMLVSWERLHADLVGLVVDLFPAAALRFLRCEQPSTAEQPFMLASLPVRLEVSATGSFVSGLPLPALLGTAWGVTLLALLVLAATLRTSISYGERRARFASAVTHELRTPLTTFRMYSEMLADGVVSDPAARQEYFGTLQREADRLARVVENVLVWSRLEEGRFAARILPTPLLALVDRIAPTLARRLDEAGMQLRVTMSQPARDLTLATDEDAVGQILFNLIDNAAKYARRATSSSASGNAVDLQVEASEGEVRLVVRDHGPGIPRALRARIFAPFDRGAVAPGCNDVPGVGLGLALARGLARDLGGDLQLRPGAEPGAAFLLRLPCPQAGTGRQNGHERP